MCVSGLTLWSRVTNLRVLGRTVFPVLGIPRFPSSSVCGARAWWAFPTHFGTNVVIVLAQLMLRWRVCET